jgi:tetratricopeptide (TPR) repeat protein
MQKGLLIIFALLFFAFPALAQEVIETPEPLPECPIFEDQSTDVRTSYYMGEGLAYMASEQLAAAEFSFTCIIRVIQPDYMPAYMSRANIYTRYRDYERAIEDYTSAIELSPNLLPAFNNRGILYTALREYEEAAADFDRVLELDPAYMAGYNNRSILYAVQGDWDNALSTLQGAIERSGIETAYEQLTDPERPSDAPEVEYDAIDARAYALIGIVYSSRALENYQKYLFLARGGADQRIQSAAGALESRFTFETRLDDGTWLLTADFSPVGEEED